ncbi:MAG: hypothetical protein AAF202_10635, partial [Pseudomonadota bacterium]
MFTRACQFVTLAIAATFFVPVHAQTVVLTQEFDIQHELHRVKITGWNGLEGAVSTLVGGDLRHYLLGQAQSPILEMIGEWQEDGLPVVSLGAEITEFESREITRWRETEPGWLSESVVNQYGRFEVAGKVKMSLAVEGPVPEELSSWQRHPFDRGVLLELYAMSRETRDTVLLASTAIDDPTVVSKILLSSTGRMSDSYAFEKVPGIYRTRLMLEAATSIRDFSSETVEGLPLLAAEPYDHYLVLKNENDLQFGLAGMLTEFPTASDVIRASFES